MQSKTTVIVVIILIVVLALAAYFYFFKQDKSAVNPTENVTNETTTEENLVNEQYAVEGNDQTNAEQSQNQIVTDDFSIALPVGWSKAVETVPEALAIAINPNETINDVAAQNINFKSYLAVSSDKLQDKTFSEYAQSVKSGLEATLASAVFTKDQDMTINGNSAHATELEMTQEGINFKVLLVIIKGEGEETWILSF